MQANWARIILVLVAAAECTLTAPIISGSNVIQLGRNTTLQCTVVSTVQEIDWTTTALSANISNQTFNIFGDVVSEILHLTNVDSGYCGVYTCTVADANMISMSASTSVSVVPILEVALVNQTHSESPGLEVSFTCSINGGIGSSVEIVWSGPVDLPEPTIIESSDGVFTSNLTLSNVTATFTGIYQCTGRYNNSLCFADVSSNASLVVIAPPTIIDQTELPSKVDSGETATLYFMFLSLPSHTDVNCVGPDGVVFEEIRMDNNTQQSIRIDIKVSSVNFTHGGEYLCTANNSAGDVTATTLLLVRPVVEPNKVLAKNGDNITLMCLVQSFPEPSYVWEMFRDSNDSDTFPDEFGFVSGSGENMMATHPFLDFEPVGYGDAGVYRCMVNINGTWLFSDEVLLAVSPEGSVMVEAVNMTLLYDPNEPATLNCIASGGPNNTFMWFLDGDLINETSNTLVFSEVEGGEYTCQVSNAAGNENASIILTEAPHDVMIASGSNIDLNVASLNDIVMLMCINSGGPNNTYEWAKDEMILDSETSDTLTLTIANGSSGGNYTCIVSNAAGSGSASTTLYVAPYIVTPLEEQTLTTNGSNVNISCDADGFPSPTVSWVDMTNAEVMNTSLLEFSPVMFGDEGLYRCVATAEISGVNFTAMDNTIIVVSPVGGVTIPLLNPVFSQGNNSVLICTAFGGPSNTFLWKMNGSIIGNDSMLEVMDIDASSGGDYMCTVSNAAGNDSASITLYVAPYIVTPLEEQILTINGSNVNISCDADGFPSPTVSWVDVTSAEVVNASMLEFSPVMFGDEGLYRCVATAEISGVKVTSMDDTIIVVSPKSSVVVSPLNMVFNQGYNATFICTAFGGPDNFFLWKMNGNIIGNDSVLEVMDIDASFGGNYTCTVSNTAGSDSASTTLYVAPYIVTPLEEQILTTNGSNVNIGCDADGFPSPTVSWVDVTNAEVMNTSLLEFSSVMFGDEGFYRCVATAEINGMRFTTTDDTILIVSPESSLSVSPLNMVFNQRNDVTFICDALGGPNNTFQWQMDGNIIGNDSTLEVMDIDASSGGVYTCTVSNAAGSDSASTTLFVAPYIVTPLEEQTLTFNGSSINLTCEADGFPLPTVSWDRNTTNVAVSNDSELIIPTVTFGQEGVYRCLANVTINGVEYEDSDITTVIVSTEGSVMVTPVDQVFTRGENVTLTCISMGGPGNAYQWEKDGNIVATDDILTLMDIDASSGGIYTCTVSNLAGNDSATTTLYVAPYFILHPENVETSNSSEVNISCLAESFPEPEYMWMKDGDSSLVREGVITVDMPNSLGFRPVLFGDEGVYVCVAFITIDMVVHNESSDTTVLAVSPEGSIQVNPTAINGNDSGIATFTCMALGGPENMFSWTKVRDNRNITNDSELMLVDIMASDGGVYQCAVENLAGSESDTVTLNVSPVVTEHPQHQNVISFEGTIMLSCTATGFPAPAITWFHNNSMEDNASSQRINDYTTRSIFIMSMPATNDSGMYFCRAAVDGYDDVDSNRVTVLVQDIPEQPQNITAVETQSRYLVLMWVEPHDNNAPILGYFISYNQPVFAGGERIILNVSEEMVNVTNLLPGVIYNFTVIAYNNIGNSTASETTPLSTLEEVPGNSPQNVTAVSLSSTAITVTWEEIPPIDRNGMITTYEVLYEPLETFGQLSSTDIINATDLFVILEGLHPFVGYNISVRAYTSVGNGPYSDMVVEITLEDSPGMPQNVSAMVNSSTEIIVYWEEVPAFNRNGTILLYEVLYRSTLDQTQTLNTTDNSTFSLSLQVEEFSMYNITVRAYTVAGAGEESMPVVVVITPPVPPGTPAPPMVPTMDEITSSSALVHWNPIPERFANGDITNYVINYRISESGNRMKRQTVDGMVVPECIIGGVENNDRNLTVGGDQTNATLQSLTPSVTYEVRILAINTEGSGEFSNSITFSTNEDIPSAPRNLSVVAMGSSTSLQVTWESPLCEYGTIVNYTLTYSPIEDDGTAMGTPSSGENIPPNQTSIQVTNLSINTGYRVSVVAATSAGTGTPAIQTGMTDEDAPQAVTNLRIESSQLAMDSNNVTVNFSWTGPSIRNGSYNYYVTFSGEQVDDYPERRSRKHPNTVVILDGSNMSHSITGLPYANYTINVTAFNIKTRRPGPSTIHEDRTISIGSSPVTTLKAVASSSESINVMWDLPEYPNGPLSEYRIYYQRSNMIIAPPESTANTKTVLFPTQAINITGLEVFTNYSIFITAIGISNITGNGNGTLQRTNTSFAEIDLSSTSSVPIAPPNADSFSFDLPLLTITTGPLKLYAVIIVRVTAGFDGTDTMKYNDVGPYVDSDQPYVAAAWSDVKDIPNTRPFVVGDGSQTTVGDITYTNVPLRSNTQYAALVRVEIVSDNPDMRLISYSSLVMATTDLSYDPIGLGVGLVFVIIGLICAVVAVVLVVYFYRTKYYLPRHKGYANEIELDDSSTNVQSLSIIQNPALVAKPYGHLFEPIPLADFKEHVKNLHRNDDYPFSDEYSNVEPSHAPTSEATHYPYNASKNRYANISAYDHSRVRLNEIPGRPGSDYINANYIDGYKLEKGFIATQGPVPDSVPDFWRMIWEQNTATIVMVTNLEEKGRVKCHQYWPDEKTSIYGSMRVHIQEILVLAEYTVRTFSVTKDDSKDERIVTQYHYTIWPDHGVPEYPTSLLHFVRKVMVSNPPNSGPIVVHCSAGVGRTGTFITLFNQLRRIDNEKNVNVFNFVRSMRRNRCCMVQTESQYIFIHDALLEAIECGITEVAARDLREQYKRLGAVDEVVGLTGLEIEFDKLDSTIHRRPTNSFGTLQVNKSKNRYANVDMLPYDTSRCRLSFIPGVEGSDYINANYVDGYHKRKAFIATQGPLPDTSDDFWRMVWEQKCATIVMLTKEREGGRVKCHRYWPTTGASNFRQYQVILHAVNEYPDYILREFKIVDTKDGSSLPVKQFQYTGWPEEGVPDVGTGLIDLVGQVQKWQRNSGTHPIVIHCSGGSGRTGTFISISILLERLKTEGVVDVFHTGRTLRLQRPGLIQTVDQYEFCYKTVLEYLDSFELYANFK